MTVAKHYELMFCCVMHVFVQYACACVIRVFTLYLRSYGICVCVIHSCDTCVPVPDTQVRVHATTVDTLVPRFVL